jgi:hypothetical protein
MNEDLREAIELIRELANEYSPAQMNDYKHADAEEEKIFKAFTKILTTAEQVLEAGEELPNCDYTYEDDIRVFKRATNLCQPILAKKNLRIKELEETLSMREEIVDYHTNTDGLRREEL